MDITIFDGTVHVSEIDTDALQIITAEEAGQSEHHVEVQFPEIVEIVKNYEIIPSVALRNKEGTECVEDEKQNVTEMKDHDYARKNVLGNYSAESILAESVVIVASEDKHTELDVEEEGPAVRGDVVLEQAGEARIPDVKEAGNEDLKFGVGVTESVSDLEVDIDAGISGVERCDVKDQDLIAQEEIDLENSRFEVKEGKANVKLDVSDLSIDPQLEMGKILNNEIEVVNFMKNYMDKKKCVFVVGTNNTNKGSGGVSF